MLIIDDLEAVPEQRGTKYPAPLAQGFAGRVRRRLGDAVGLTQFGVNLTTLAPGAMSAHRHWHAREDEFIYVLCGELVLVTDEGERTLSASMAAGFPAGDGNGHHLINRSDEPATYLEIGTRSPDEVAHYPDVDLVAEKRAGVLVFLRKDGTPYE